MYLEFNNLSGKIPDMLGRKDSSGLLPGGMQLNNNEFTFAGMEAKGAAVTNGKDTQQYSPQAEIHIIGVGNILSVSVGGTPANNTYLWYNVGSGLIKTSIGDSTFSPSGYGNYVVVVNNSVANKLTLYSDTITMGVLPIILLDLSTEIQNESVKIAWQTTNEVNTSYFTVQRSTDGIHFTNIGKVNATNTSGNHSYSYQDDLASLSATKVYYRLQMVDKDGSSKESSIVSLSLSNDQKITIVPNPAHNYFTVSGNLAAKNTLLVTDMSGKVVLVKNNVTGNEKISISGLSKGIYLVKMDDGKTVTVKKLIVE